MTVKFLGSGGAFSTDDENYNSNIAIYEDDDYLLFDAGTDIKNSLHHARIAVANISQIFISHLHSDHAGGVEYMGFRTMFDPNIDKKITLISEKSILVDGWAKSWSGGMEDMQSGHESLESFFDTKYLAKDEPFSHCGIEINLVENRHVVSVGKKVPSYGIAFESNKKVYISGDSKFERQKLEKFFEYDIIFHECSFASQKCEVHSSVYELDTLPQEVKAKMWLYHYSLQGREFEEVNSEVTERGFAGLVQRGELFSV